MVGENKVSIFPFDFAMKFQKCKNYPHDATIVAYVFSPVLVFGFCNCHCVW